MTISLRVRVTAADKVWLTETAERRGKTLSDYIRDRLDDALWLKEGRSLEPIQPRGRPKTRGSHGVVDAPERT